MVAVCSLGSHSALDICEGAKKERLKTVVVCQRGREKTYVRHRCRNAHGREIGIIDEIILLDKFADIVNEPVKEKLQELECVFVPNRSFSVYVGYDNIEKKFNVPIFGNRWMLRAEERYEKKNQYYLLKKAGIRFPRQLKPEEIDTLVIVKAPEAKRSYERAFFFATSYEEYEQKAREMLEKCIITKEGLESAVIEEYVVGAQFNFNYFYSPLSGELELLGIDMRRQTNIDGILRLPAKEQLELLKYVRVKNIEVGHVACTLRESLLEEVFELGERFVEASKKEYPPGIIGPFALQGAVVPEEKGEKPVIFDVSMRVPGSPGTRFTPYTEYLWREPMSTGRRIAIEIREAEETGRMKEITT
ncbi:MAG: formate--phosphoribosylaminoimidazolecarboxamide ligase family protein [Candidatus Micrarchaeia archaeon]